MVVRGHSGFRYAGGCVVLSAVLVRVSVEGLRSHRFACFGVFKTVDHCRTEFGSVAIEVRCGVSCSCVKRTGCCAVINAIMPKMFDIPVMAKSGGGPGLPPCSYVLQYLHQVGF